MIGRFGAQAIENLTADFAEQRKRKIREIRAIRSLPSNGRSFDDQRKLTRISPLQSFAILRGRCGKALSFGQLRVP